MKTIRNSITYTVEVAQLGGGSARYENQTVLYRPYYLTYQGAQRIIRRNTCKSSAIVTEVNSMAVDFQKR